MVLFDLPHPRQYEDLVEGLGKIVIPNARNHQCKA